MGAILRRLPPFLFRRRRRRLQPGLDRGVLRVKIGKVRDEVLDDLEMRQRIDLHRAFDLVHAARAGERVDAVDVHRAGAADALAAGAPERQRRIDLRLYPDQRVEHHRPAVVAIDNESVDARVGVVVRVPAIDAEFRGALRGRRRRPGLAGRRAGILGEGELDHGFILSGRPSSRARPASASRSVLVSGPGTGRGSTGERGRTAPWMKMISAQPRTCRAVVVAVGVWRDFPRFVVFQDFAARKISVPLRGVRIRRSQMRRRRVEARPPLRAGPKRRRPEAVDIGEASDLHSRIIVASSGGSSMAWFG